MTDQDRVSLAKRDYLALAAFCVLLFGLSLVSGRPLSVHESVLPQSAREMYADGDWVVPKRGGAPWLESPPLPQWVTVSIATVFGRCDEVWIARIGPVLGSTAVVLMVAWMANLWFGRAIGGLSGLIMATTCQFTRYAWLAEDEIYLCGIVTTAMALFVRLEFGRSDEASHPGDYGLIGGFLRGRSMLVAAFFVVLGMTNLAKGLVFGTAMAVIPIAGFLLWNCDLSRIKRYIWFWGWLAFLGIMLAWPVAAYFRYPSVLDLWKFDLGGRLDGSYLASAEPLWYYPVNLLWILAPWTFVIPFGFLVTRDRALRTRFSPERFLWCWAILVPLVFSLSQGKHHHYLLHAIAPWAVLASHGLVNAWKRLLASPKWFHHPCWSLVTTAAPIMVVFWILRERIPGPTWFLPTVLVLCPLIIVFLSWAIMHTSGRHAAAALFSAVAMVYGTGHWLAGDYVDKHRFDAKFLQAVHDRVPSDETILVDMDVSPLRSFFCLFYLGDNTVPLHNLSFIRDDKIVDRDVYFVTRLRNRATLAEVGTVDFEMQSERTGNEESPEDRLALFRMRFHPGTQSLSSDGLRISPMQAMYRENGPVLR